VAASRPFEQAFEIEQRDDRLILRTRNGQLIASMAQESLIPGACPASEA
jgi:hypothetical protein